MNRWVVRILGIVLLLAFVMLMLNLQRQLATLQQTRQPPATSTDKPP